MFHNELMLLSWMPVILEQIFTIVFKLFMSFTDRLLVQHMNEKVKRLNERLVKKILKITLETLKEFSILNR